VTNKSNFVLLIVDDERSVCRALSRLLENSIKTIQTATNPTEAEMVLNSRDVTHLICDHWFGPGQPLGIDLVAKWKKKYTSIKRAVVLTGTDISNIDTSSSVDKILPKVVDPDDLIKTLGLS